MAKGYVQNIEKLTEDNPNFRKVLYTSHETQLVVMSLKPNEEIGMETHPENDQFIRVEEGKGKAIIDGNPYNFESGYCVIIPKGSKHNIVNTSETQELKLYTLYSPPHHRLDVVHKTKKDAEKDDEDFDGETNE